MQFIQIKVFLIIKKNLYLKEIIVQNKLLNPYTSILIDLNIGTGLYLFEGNIFSDNFC